MWLPRFKQSHPLRLFLALLLVLVSGALILAHWNRGDVPTAGGVMAQGQSPQTPLQAELITVTPAGFEPAEITRPQGRFLLAIDNRSGLDEIDFHLAPARLRDGRALRERGLLLKAIDARLNRVKALFE